MRARQRGQLPQGVFDTEIPHIVRVRQREEMDLPGAAL
jgi:hypothetical protein